ncbi:class I SAM-dependent methyltransferase [Actinomarinicola tropica]|uniref:Methyltransferase domain-containing protein n=1 Tax=Actinomarinicola tropica TaxID=2789776 RepID=A0A5Q2RSJ3_9ACTN|nr:class I SAM-dependent methyltransferase [Actinomarinicola tropica]QGG96880.1 methyltransferase domain-containing protein [Actinomarinicola tropica]
MSTAQPAPGRPETFPHGADLPLDRVVYGPDVADESQLRLLGDLQGKRVLQLGAGEGHTTVALHRHGARVIVVEPSESRLASARRLFDREDLKVEVLPVDLADLAGVRAESIDLALSVHALAEVDDLPRLFRQVHRVLRPEHPFVFSLPHPAFAMIEPGSDEPLRVRRAYWDESPRRWAAGGHEGADRSHTIGQLFTGLTRSNFRVDTLHEPEPPSQGARSPLWSDAMRWVPSTLVVRARKQGL